MANLKYDNNIFTNIIKSVKFVDYDEFVKTILICESEKYHTVLWTLCHKMTNYRYSQNHKEEIAIWHEMMQFILDLDNSYLEKECNCEHSFESHLFLRVLDNQSNNFIN